MNRSFLVVGDVLEQREHHVEAEDLDVVICSSAAQARQLLRSGKSYQVLFCDRHMLDADGVCFVKEICRDFPELPVVIVTDAREVKFGIFGMLHGACDCIQKPVDFLALRASFGRARMRKQIELSMMYGGGALADTAS